jgi:hypothetical protein
MVEKGIGKNKDYYIHLANGDFNYCGSDEGETNNLDIVLEQAEWEMTTGCQGWILITNKKIKGEQLNKLQEILK